MALVMTTAVITGLPGTGKTRLALAAAAALAHDREVRVLHTDLVKAMLRDLQPGYPGGPGYLAPEEKCRRAHPLLAAQAEKARREGVLLVVEGTLAAGFTPPDGLAFRLTLDEATRARRIAAKPGPARDALAVAGDLAAYRVWLAGTLEPGAIVLDAARPLADLVGDVAAALRGLTTPVA